MTDMQTWLAAPLEQEVSEALQRLRRAPDVQQIAVMPDVHLAADVCIGVALATSSLIYPQAVGGDIGCGMLAAALNTEAATLSNPKTAGQILAALTQAIPARRRHRNATIRQPPEVAETTLSHPALETLRRHEGALEFATLGSGNHFIELQCAQDDNRLWLMVHSGSRALGPAIRDHHLSRASPAGHQLYSLNANSPAGAAYLTDASWARGYAAASRRAIAEQIAQALHTEIDWESLITTDHNHVARETHDGRPLWVHRKGAMPAHTGEPGVLPGSMGTASFHVEGRGHAPALCSSAHGAGRALSRTQARAQVSERDLARQMTGVWYNARLAEKLRDEAPSAYKDIRAVLRAQRDLVKVTRTLRPLLNYKGV